MTRLGDGRNSGCGICTPALSAEPDAAQLHDAGGAVYDLAPGALAAVRSSVQSLPADKRIERIKEIVREQQKRRFRDFARDHLPAEDQEHIYQWLDKFVADNEKEISMGFRPRSPADSRYQRRRGPA